MQYPEVVYCVLYFVTCRRQCALKHTVVVGSWCCFCLISSNSSCHQKVRIELSTGLLGPLGNTSSDKFGTSNAS